MGHGFPLWRRTHAMNIADVAKAYNEFVTITIVLREQIGDVQKLLLGIC